jgi:N-methylhydantoinase B
VETLPHLTKCENFPLRTGDRIVRHSPGGGGLGPVQERDPQLVEDDLREGYVTADNHEAARSPA